MNYEPLLLMLKDVAEQVVPTSGSRHAAALLYKGRVISIGINSRKTHSFAAEYGKCEGCEQFHAETHAIHQGKRLLSSLERCTLIVVRAKKVKAKDAHYVFGSSRPCAGCMRCIQDHNVRTLVYSEECTKKDEMKYFVEINLRKNK